jgi:hypothetical protein
MNIPDPAATLSGNLPALRPDTHPIPVITDDEWDNDSTEWVDRLRDDGQPLTDLRTEHYTEQVVAALHGDPAVLTLDPLTQDCIASISRVFELFARQILTEDNGATEDAWNGSKAVIKRGAVLLMAGGGEGGTPMRCPSCGRIHQPLAIGGPINWDIAGREDIMCPQCWAKQPKHTVKPAAPVKAKTASNGTRRRRTPRPKPAGGTP